jgi:hypothetical protein
VSTRADRVVSVAGLVAGAVLLARPERVLTPLAPEYPGRRRWIVRVLGARLVAQHAAVLAAPTPAVLRASAGADLLHAASMVPLLRSPRYGRAARISAAVAALYGAWGARRGR